LLDLLDFKPPMDIVKLKSTRDLTMAYPLMKELRTHLSRESFFQLYKSLSEESRYSLVGIFEDSQIVGLGGYRYTTDFIRGEHLYVDDLIIKGGVRSKGLGTKLINHLIDEANQRGIHLIRLSTHKDNTRAINFYKERGFVHTSLSFELP